MSDSGGDPRQELDDESSSETSDPSQTQTQTQAQTESARALEETIRILFGFAGCVVFFYLVDRSMQESYTLDPHVAYSMLGLIVFLFAGAKGATGLLDAWSGR